MNGKQARKSRALKREIDNHTEKLKKELRALKERDTAEVIALYNMQLYKLPFRKRVAYCFRIMQCGQRVLNKRTAAYILALIGVLALWFTI